MCNIPRGVISRHSHIAEELCCEPNRFCVLNSFKTLGLERVKLISRKANEGCVAVVHPKVFIIFALDTPMYYSILTSYPPPRMMKLMFRIEKYFKSRLVELQVHWY